MIEDMMIRVPRELHKRFKELKMYDSWKGFPSFVREAIRFYLNHYEEIDRLDRLKQPTDHYILKH